jgi:release factor glutamine methyltransferase
VCGETATLAALAAAGLRPRVVARRPGPLGQRLTARASVLEARGLLPAGRREEELMVISATRSTQLLNLRRPDALIRTVGRGTVNERRQG